MTTTQAAKSNSAKKNPAANLSRKPKPGAEAAAAREAAEAEEKKAAEEKAVEEAAAPAEAVTTEEPTQPSTPTPLAEPSATTKYQQRMAKLSAARRIEVKMRNADQRFVVIAKFMETWEEHPEAKAAAAALDLAFENFLLAIKQVPDTFKPKGFTKTPSINVPLAAGATVSLRAKIAGSYEGVIDGEEREGLTVLTITPKGKVVCQTKGGEKVVLPRGHVVTKS